MLEFRSNVIGGRDALDVFSFDGEAGTARSGFTSFAPAVKFNPIKNVGNFTIQSALHIPLVDNETEDGVFLDQNGFIFQNRFFYDYSFADGNWQLFTELNTEYNFPKEGSFADNSLRLIPGVFLSYFPSSKFTVLGLVQHLQLISFEDNGFEQDATILGGGAKYQLTDELNIEFLYSNFVRGNDTGLGETFNIGLRALF
ncbi:MAG: transporter [Bacteroidota bacterium]